MDCKTLLDNVQRHLHDAATLGDDGLIWSRAELLTYLSDGYRQLLARSKSVRRFTTFDLPPRVTLSFTQDWERHHLMGGTGRQFTYAGADRRRQCTALWEVEQQDISTPKAGHTCVTHLWEMAHTSGTVDTHYRVALPRNHDQPNQLWHDHEPLTATSVRSLDQLGDAWYRTQGDPWYWTPGVGAVQTLELYEIVATYGQAYAQSDLVGVPRHAGGNRTYAASTPDGGATWAYAYTSPGDADKTTQGGAGLRITTATATGRYALYDWEVEQAAGETPSTTAGIVGTYPWEADHASMAAANVTPLPTGALRRASSPDRQYVSALNWEAPLGTVRAWGSSANSLLLLETVSPDVPDLADSADSSPDMLPAQLHKYLGWYTLACALNRQGEGYNPTLAAHWLQRYGRAERLMRRLEDVGWKSKRLRRRSAGSVGRRELQPPALPSAYPKIRWA